VKFAGWFDSYAAAVIRAQNAANAMKIRTTGEQMSLEKKKMNKPDTVMGSRPTHVHRNAAGESWNCNSPYCEDVNTSSQEHPEDGGPVPVFAGREPWRGR
jgi:hypothetical protein